MVVNLDIYIVILKEKIKIIIKRVQKNESVAELLLWNGYATLLRSMSSILLFWLHQPHVRSTAAGAAAIIRQ